MAASSVVSREAGGERSTGEPRGNPRIAPVAPGTLSLSLLATTARRLKIRGRRPREARIIVVIAEAEIARAAQKAAHLSGRMTMIDAQWPVRSLADRARMSLAREDGPVLLQGQPVAASARL